MRHPAYGDRVSTSDSDGQAITAAGLQTLRAELEDLETAGRAAMAERINAARQLGDLKENADYHIAKDIGWALTGKPVDDEGLAELLEPYRGHRYRVQHLSQGQMIEFRQGSSKIARAAGL